MKKLFLCALSVMALAASGCTENPFPFANSSNHEIFYITPGDYTSIPVDFERNSQGLTQCQSCETYRSAILDAAARELADHRFSYNNTYHSSSLFPDIYISADETATGKATIPSGQIAPSFTTTNTQESDVDEMDTTKNDSKYLYHVSNYRVMVSRIWPVKSAKLYATIEPYIDSTSELLDTNLLLDGERLLVLDVIQMHDGLKQTHVRVYDVHNPAAPALLKRHTFDGKLETARMVNHKAILVINASSGSIFSDLSNYYLADIPGIPEYSEIGWGDNYSSDKRRQYIDDYLPIIRGWVEEHYGDKLNDHILPQYSDENGQKPLFSCSDIYLAYSAQASQTLTVAVELSGSNFDALTSAAISAPGSHAYASTDNLFIAENSFENESACMWEMCNQVTPIHQFSLGKDAGPIQYVGATQVIGTINSPFWMSEYDGFLRVVSQDSWSGVTLNIFDLSDDISKSIGRISNIAPGEDVYAVRMFDDRGYIVTFRQVDPLYTLDMSDPFNPVNPGTLEIPGYSTYIHPIDRDHLLAFGIDGDTFGNMTGPQLQIFDVSNFSNPVRTHNLAFLQDTKFTEIPALKDHHLVNFHPGSGLLSFPATYKSAKEEECIAVYRIDTKKGFSLLGRVNHESFGNSGNLKNTPYNSRFYFGSSNFSKDAYILTLSDAGLKINDANAPSTEYQAIAFEQK
ncbi:MAG: beta-propeller domain-containing protein [Proteobacteria bacterium]|nr:beta-propeller domain-containing protein [Pseudomonadota bacterium]